MFSIGNTPLIKLNRLSGGDLPDEIGAVLDEYLKRKLYN
jgi:hypothetical protein